jgi:hypothetical protein
MRKKGKYVYIVYCAASQDHQQSSALGRLDRLPAEIAPSLIRGKSEERSPFSTRVGNGDFSSACEGGWIRRKPECGPMKRSVRDYARDILESSWPLQPLKFMPQCWIALKLAHSHIPQSTFHHHKP